MRRFFIKKDKDWGTQKWSPRTFMFCPHCFEKNTFYNRLKDNQCVICHKKMPFPSEMIKNEEKRIEYHLGEYKC